MAPPKSKSTATITYANPGTVPPLYLAGSFTVPPWEPQPMDYTEGADGEFRFHKVVTVEAGHEYQYKFRDGSGDWWVLDESAPVATDDIGNRNNRLSIPPLKASEELSGLDSEVPVVDEKTVKEFELPEPEPLSAPVVSEAVKEPEAQAEPEILSAPVIDEKTVKESEAQAEPELSSAPVIDEKVVEEPELQAEPESSAPVINKEAVKESEPESSSAPVVDEKAVEEPELQAEPEISSAPVINEEAKPEPEVESSAPVTNEEAVKEPESQPELESPSAPVIDEEVIEEPELAAEPELSSAPVIDEKTETNEEVSESQHVPIPTLVVEKTDNELSHGDDFGKNATSEQKDAHDIRSKDAEADFVIVRRESNESETAAEVADSAAIVDRPVTPQVSSDEDAGRTGERRMSMTPIPQVSDTAAEVADVAAVLDKGEATPDMSDNEAGRTGERRLSMTPIPQVSDTAAEVADVASKLDDESNLSSAFASPDVPTPANEQAPLFAHECIGPYEAVDADAEDEDYDVEEPAPIGADEAKDIDLNDPTLEEFPHDRSSIILEVRSAGTRLNEDKTAVFGSPPSPIIKTEHFNPDMSDSGRVPSFSHEMQDPPHSPLAKSFAQEMEDHTLSPVFTYKAQSPRQSPRHSPSSSLGSIAEEEDEEELILDRGTDAKRAAMAQKVNDSNVEVTEIAHADSKASRFEGELDEGIHAGGDATPLHSAAGNGVVEEAGEAPLMSHERALSIDGTHGELLGVRADESAPLMSHEIDVLREAPVTASEVPVEEEAPAVTSEVPVEEEAIPEPVAQETAEVEEGDGAPLMSHERAKSIDGTHGGLVDIRADESAPLMSHEIDVVGEVPAATSDVPAETESVPESEHVEAVPVETASVPEAPVEPASVPEVEPLEAVPVETASVPEAEPVETKSVPEAEPVEAVAVEIAAVPEAPVEAASVPEAESVEATSIPEAEPVEISSVPEAEPVETASIPKASTSEEPAKAELIPEAEAEAPVSTESIPEAEAPVNTESVPEADAPAQAKSISEADEPVNTESTPEPATKDLIVEAEPGDTAPLMPHEFEAPQESNAERAAEVGAGEKTKSISETETAGTEAARAEAGISTSLAPNGAGTVTKRRETREERSESALDRIDRGIDRSKTPTSIRSTDSVSTNGNFLIVFWRTVFVGWIGGFLSRVCGGDGRKRNA